MLLGGRVAEEVALKHMTTGAGNDLERATDLARKMVCEWGMSEKLGPLTFGKKEEQIFLGREIAQHRDYSEHTAIEIDEEVRRIVTEAYQKTKDILTENKVGLDTLATALLEKETLDGKEIWELLTAAGMNVPEIKSSPDGKVISPDEAPEPTPGTPTSGPTTA
jgi:cell division protease FtsH